MKKTISIFALLISAQLMFGQLVSKVPTSNTLQGLKIQKSANGQMTTQLKDGTTATVYWTKSRTLSAGRYKVSYLVKHPESDKPLRIDETWDETTKKLISTSEIAGNELIVTLKPNKSATDLSYILMNVGAQIEHHIPNSNIYVISFSADEPEVLDNIKTYLESNKEIIESVSKNKLYRLDAIPNDPQMDWGLSKIKAPEAWNTSTGSKSVLIGIADTGTDIEHPDLQANIWLNPGENGTDQSGNNKATNGIDDDNNGYIDDLHGYDFVNHNNNVNPDRSYSGSYHGTHVAGTVAATGNNGIGVVGVNWNASIVTLKIAGNSLGAWESASKESMIYAASIGCQVINNSWGMTTMFDDETIDETRNRFSDYEKAGGIAVFSAGNDNTDNDGTYTHYPSAYPFPNIVAVGASNSTENPASFSCYGKTSVDIFAPGDDVLSTLPTYKNPSGYGLLSGTSMSAPYVTGLFGLLKSAHPELTMFQIRDAIFRSVDTFDSYKDKCVTGGIINANKALAALNGMTGTPKPLAPVIENITQPSGSSYEGSITISGLPIGNWVIYSENQAIRLTGTGNVTKIDKLEPAVYQFYVVDSLGISTPFTNSIEIKMNPNAPNPPSINSVSITDCSNYLARIELDKLPSLGKWTVKTKMLDPFSKKWIITKDSVKGNGKTAQVQNLPSGSYKFAVTPENGCISPYSDVVLVTEKPNFDRLLSKVIKRKCGTLDQESIYLKFKNLNTEQQYSIIQSKINPKSNAIEELASFNLSNNDTCFVARNIGIGKFRFMIRSNIGCTSDTLQFTLYPATSKTPETPNIVSITNPSGYSNFGKITIGNLPKTGKYKLNIIPLGKTGRTMTAFSSGENATFAGIIPGKYVASVTIDSSLCESNPSTEFIIQANPSLIYKPYVTKINEPKTCFPYGSVTLCNLPIGPWIITETSGKKTISGTGTCVVIDTLSAGIYSFMVTNQYGQNSDTVKVEFHQPSATIPSPKIKSITQPNAYTQNGIIKLDGLIGVEYVVNLRNYLQFYTKISFDDELIIYNLKPGEYKFASVQFNGEKNYCFSDSTELITINSLPNEVVLTPSIDYIYHPTCSSPKGLIEFSDLPTGNWVLKRKPDIITIYGKGEYYTLFDVPSGNYSFSVENQFGYSSSWTEDVTIQKGPTRPLTPQIDKITHPTSTTHTGSVLLKGIYNDPFYKQASITQYPDMRSYSVYGDSVTISNLLPGKYYFKINSNYSSCESDTTEHITINPLPDDVVLTPTVSKIFQPECGSTNGSVTLGNLPTTGTWTITRYPDNTKYVGQGTSFTVMDLASGVYYFKVTNQAGYTSGKTTDITINAPKIKAKTPTIALITQPDNLSQNGNVLLTNIDRNVTGYIILLPENTSFYVTGSQQTITNIPPGKHTLYFRSNSSTYCDSDPTNIFTINPAPISIIPDAPNVDYVNQPSCYSATASVQISDLPKIGEWTITMNPGNVINAGSGTTTTISDILPGVYTFTVTNSSGYTSLSSNSVTIQSQASKAPTPIVDKVTQPTEKTLYGTVVLTSLPSKGTNYVNISGSSSSYYSSISISGTTCTITDLEPGTYKFSVQNYNFSCQSDYTQTVSIDLPTHIVLTPIIDSTYYQTETSCYSGTRDIRIKNLPYKGDWTLTRHPDLISIFGSGTTMTIDLKPGKYWFSVTNSSGITSSLSKEVTIMNTTKSETPIISQVTQPTSNNDRGSVLLGNLTPKSMYEITTSRFSDLSISYNYNYYTVDYTGTVLITYLRDGKYQFKVREMIPNNCVSDPTPFVILGYANGIDNIQHNSNLKLFPNPVENQLTIERLDGIESTNFQIINAQGEIITTGILEDMISLSLSHLPAGVYLLKLDDGTTAKFIKK